MSHEQKEPACPGCYQLIFDSCGEELEFPTGLAEGLEIRFEITDKFGKRYRFTSEVGPDGIVSIETNLFPAGLFSPFSGNFRFEIVGSSEEEVVCDSLEMTICEHDYDCISFSFASTYYPTEENEEPYSETY